MYALTNYANFSSGKVYTEEEDGASKSDFGREEDSFSQATVGVKLVKHNFPAGDTVNFGG